MPTDERSKFDLTGSADAAHLYNHMRAASANGAFKGFFYREFTLDPGSLNDAAGSTHSQRVQGVALGDIVLVSAPYDLQDITVTAYVQAANLVEVRIQNESGNTVDLASGTWRALVFDVT